MLIIFFIKEPTMATSLFFVSVNSMADGFHDWDEMFRRAEEDSEPQD